MLLENSLRLGELGEGLSCGDELVDLCESGVTDRGDEVEDEFKLF